ncbi:hypothetical protein SanaruYs_28610 [Chryseotalea sanaruensis]|uniref:Uncharacterized protein n=1 Tax=Chryseotalea sanaruensis TaxID=2482724 RepID=A0A401UCL5_9BACT|nr:hypothetical protein SanaruYs_28610 [Chryseotalea sanaruensis]
MRPTPPTCQVGHKEKSLQKHIRVKLHLVKEKEEKDNIDNTNWPTPDISPSRKPHRYTTCYRSEELDVAHGITQDGEKNIIDIKKFHAYLAKVSQSIDFSLFEHKPYF